MRAGAGCIKLDAAYTYYPTYAEVLQGLQTAPPRCRSSWSRRTTSSSKQRRISPRRAADAAPPGVLEALSGAAGAVLRQPLHLAVRERLAAAPRHDRQRSARLPRRTSSRKCPGSPRPRPGPRIVMAGYGTFAAAAASTRATTSPLLRPRRNLAISYLPQRGVSRSRWPACGLARAQWYDPANGTQRQVPWSPFAAGGSVALTAPGASADGDPDRVLVLSPRKERGLAALARPAERLVGSNRRRCPLGSWRAARPGRLSTSRTIRAADSRYGGSASSRSSSGPRSRRTGSTSASSSCRSRR